MEPTKKDQGDVCHTCCRKIDAAPGRIVVSPATVTAEMAKTQSSIFLAGGITGADDWQTTAAERILRERPSTIVFNPRRHDFVTADCAEEADCNELTQVHWEMKYLETAKVTLFWFPMGAQCPVTMFELGTLIGRADRKIALGCPLDHPRRRNLQAQLEARGATSSVGFVMHDTLDDTISGALRWLDHVYGKNM
jgi:hypothetical protein